jgi:hypothetical protein
LSINHLRLQKFICESLCGHWVADTAVNENLGHFQIWIFGISLENRTVGFNISGRGLCFIQSRTTLLVYTIKPLRLIGNQNARSARTASTDRFGRDLCFFILSRGLKILAGKVFGRPLSDVK